MIVRSSAAGLLLVVLAGCGVQRLDWYFCDNPDKGHLGPDGQPDPCHKRDPDGALHCDVGEFVHWAHFWDSPSWLWIGPEDQAPECPQGSATISYEGHADLVAPTACEACTCEPPTGSCALPSTLMASDAVCGSSGVTALFNAPTPWNGTCDSTTQTPDGAAHSLTISPIVMTENACAVGPPIAAKLVSLHWGTYALACDANWSMGPSDRSICLPADSTPPGFALCIFQNGEHACPTATDNVFTERHVFYQGVQDDRQCSECTCGAPTGSACTAAISIYKGAGCSGSPVVQVTISSSSATCTDIQLPGQALGSKEAGPTTYLPGTCPAMGGDGSGIAIPTEPATACCRP